MTKIVSKNPRSIFSLGGVFASIVLIAFGFATIGLGVTGRHEVRTNLAAEKIVGTPDMTPKAIAGEAKGAGLTNVSLPSCTVANQTVNTGARARCFASYMRIHALEASGGLTYSQMARYLDAKGKPTNNAAAAAKDPKTGAPVENGARNVWVTETALTTALNVAFFAEQVSLFSMVVGAALLLTGIGFLVLTFGALRKPPAVT
jgi:hypothetical protein